MPEIDKASQRVSQLNHIKVAPENQDALVEQMARNLDDVVASAPGFVSSTIFKSVDGGDVVNFVQWTSPELLAEAHDTDEFRNRLKAYRSLAMEGGPKLYRIAASRERDPVLPCEGPLTLHATLGSCALASHVALEWAQADYAIDLLSHAELAGAEFRAIAPKGSVPVLSTGSGQRLTESLAILNYIADSHPGARLGGVGAGERARLNESLAELVGDLHPAWAPVFVPVRFVAEGQSEDEARNTAHVRLDEKYGRWNRLLGDGDWLLFDRRTVADAYLYAMCRWKAHTPTELKAFDSLTRFKARLDRDEGIRRALSGEGLSRSYPARRRVSGS